jgi:lipid II:glycine glycyltransferase (peptidoglycan interpeptide bridge formation enzyme)
VTSDRRLADPERWDAFVQGAVPGSYLQLTGWAAAKRPNGWQAARMTAAGSDGTPIGAQVLVRRPRPLPWAFAYAPRGPVTRAWGPELVAPFTDSVRRHLVPVVGRVSHLRIDPEVEAGGPGDEDGRLRAALRSAGWRPGPSIQPPSTRLIDLRAGEDALWSDLRKKWRQYVNRARSAGVTIEEAGRDELATFYAVYRETARRAGFLIRTEESYRQIWDAFAPLGLTRLLIARESDGEPSAALFLVRCGSRVVEPYGGMTPRGAESRANYLLKWEAIRSSAERGAGTYDLWGLMNPGINHFKAGFGGRDVHYIGAWDLVLDRFGRVTFDLAQRGRTWVAHAIRGARGSREGMAATAGDGGADA